MQSSKQPAYKTKTEEKTQRKVFTTDTQTFILCNTNLHELFIQAFLPLPPPPPQKKRRLDVFYGLMHFLKKQTKKKRTLCQHMQVLA